MNCAVYFIALKALNSVNHFSGLKFQFENSNHLKKKTKWNHSNLSYICVNLQILSGWEIKIETWDSKILIDSDFSSDMFRIYWQHIDYVVSPTNNNKQYSSRSVLPNLVKLFSRGVILIIRSNHFINQSLLKINYE